MIRPGSPALKAVTMHTVRVIALGEGQFYVADDEGSLIGESRS